jgi:cold shock protein
MAQGTIKKLVADKGFGFIRDAQGQEHFFHRSACLTAFERLSEGQAVTFTESDSPKGPRAINVESRDIRG